MYAAGLWTFKGRPFPENDHISNWKQPRVRNHFLLSQLHCLDVRWSKLHGMHGAWSSHHHELDSFQWVYDMSPSEWSDNHPPFFGQFTQEAWPWHRNVSHSGRFETRWTTIRGASKNAPGLCGLYSTWINNYLKVYQMNLKPHPSWLIYDILPKDTFW